MPADPRTRDELVAAMNEGACPVCVIINRAERKAVDHFLYDQVNDISRRDALRASRGYCLQHTAMLAAGRSALGVAIVSRDILRAMTAELEAARQESGRRGQAPAAAEQLAGSRIRGMFGGLGAKPGARLAKQVAPHAGCPMCAARPQIEEPLLIGLLRNLDDPTFAAQFAASGGLCRSHIVAALNIGSASEVRRLAVVQAARWREIEAELDEFIRKHDYRFNDEIIETERDVWLRALRLSSGWYT